MLAPPTDPLAAVVHPDPYGYYAELARERRLHAHDGIGLRSVAHPDLVAEVLAHPLARVVLPTGAPPAFAEYARFTDGDAHAPLRAETIARIGAVDVDDPALATDDLDAFIERYPLYALARDLRANVKGDILFQAADATRALIGNALALIAREPGTAPADAVARVLREDPPVHNTRRTFAGDALVAGTPVAAGETILVVLVGGTLGSGPHACPGGDLAQRIAVAAVARALAAGIVPRAPVAYVPKPNVRIPLFGTGETPARSA